MGRFPTPIMIAQGRAWPWNAPGVRELGRGMGIIVTATAPLNARSDAGSDWTCARADGVTPINMKPLWLHCSLIVQGNRAKPRDEAGS